VPTKKTKKTVFVGMSGGVDSSVSAAILQEQGYDVVGVFIRTWHPDFLPCNEEEERVDAMRVATHLGIPFLTFDFEDVYKKEVADYMISEYKLGRTPNPDVMCNREVKFGAFLKKALAMGALVRPLAESYVATGHYAQNIKNNLVKGKDPTKDQSYFLWTLNQEQLSKIIFPIGHLEKTEVRMLAKKYKLPVADKKDSQGICFLGDVDLKVFLKHYIKSKKGKVLDTSGKVIGHHDGVVFSTLGERRGFTITEKTPNDKPYYVVGKDLKKNILYVSKDKNHPEKSTDIFLLKNSAYSRQSRSQSSFQDNFCFLEGVNWISETPQENKNYTAQIRYHGEFLPCKVKVLNKTKKRNNAEVIFEKPILVAGGQSIVIYDKDIVLGGGIVI